MAMVFFHIPHAPFKSANDNRTAKITVDGGELNVEQLTAELQGRIPCPSTWVWDVRREENCFIVTLPTAEDLDRVILYGDIFIKDKKIHLNFELWIEEDEGLIIPKVWFQILKVPKKAAGTPCAVGSWFYGGSAATTGHGGFTQKSFLQGPSVCS